MRSLIIFLLTFLFVSIILGLWGHQKAFQTKEDVFPNEDDKARLMHQVPELLISGGMPDTLTGSGIRIAVGDDGRVGPHIDFKGRLYQDQANQSGVDHEDMVAGILAGAGNLDPKSRGIAPGAEIVLLDNFEAIEQASVLVNTENILITSTSKGNGCNSGYNFLARTADQSARQKPFLLHFFSAGNAAETGCGHPAGIPWYSLTGGVKQSKNTCSVGNINYNLELVPGSSRGPAYDGRLKPDLVALGEDQLTTSADNQYQLSGGTSAAAPTVAGMSALLYEAYIDDHGSVPDNALVKGALLNTALDLGAEGPDFSYGFGLPLASKALSQLREGPLFNAFISDGGIWEESIQVSEANNRLRIMLIWTDREADLAASRALINDLDLEVVDPSGNVLFPLVADPSASALQAGTAAQPGVDSLNNVEQVYISSGMPGNYQLRVRGTSLVPGMQEFHVLVFQEAPELELLNAFQGQSFEPGDQIRIFWDNRANELPVTVEYKEEGQISWTSIGTSTGQSYLDWQTDPFFPGRFNVRLSAGQVFSQESEPFDVNLIPTDFEILYACPDSVLLSWGPQGNATSYQVYSLGERYMEVAGSTFQNSILLPRIPEDSSWFAIRSVLGSGIVSPRSSAILLTGNPGCPITDLQELPEKSELLVFPNPSYGRVNFSGSEIFSGIEVLDTQGKSLDRFQPAATDGFIELGRLNQGLYFLRFFKQGEERLVKIILLGQ